MAKTKKKGKKSLLEMISGEKTKTEEEIQKEEEEADRQRDERIKSLLDKRFIGRKIPKADEGYYKNDLSEEAMLRFYRDADVNQYLKIEGKFIHFQFEHMLDHRYNVGVDSSSENTLIKRISYAEISKKSFVNNINLSARYTNYFIEYFDDDDELLSAYFNTMFTLHYKDVKITAEDFINLIIVWFGTDSMFEKVVRMVEYNTDTSLVKKSERKYDESIQLTIEHLKAIMGISCFHRFVIPVVAHFYTVRGKGAIGGMTDKDLYFRIFASFIPMFDKFYDIKLYDKIYHTATTRISKTENHESVMWNRRNRFGVTTTSFTHDLMREYINELSQKTMFNKSAIVFLHVCFDQAIKNELSKIDKYEMSDMRMDASDSVNETVSRWDRWQSDKTMHSELDRLRAYVAIKDMVKSLGESVDLDFDDLNNDPKLYEEYNYYLNNIKLPLHDTQLYIIQLYFANKLGSAEVVKAVEIEDIIKLIMVMKRDLMRRNYVYIPFFISSELILTNSKKMTKKGVEKAFVQQPAYQDWVNMYPDSFDLINKDKVYSELQTLLAVPIKVVDFKHEDLVGRIMKPNDVCVVNEFTRMLCDC